MKAISTLSRTAQRALDAYGGAAHWNSLTFLEAEVSVTGLAFQMKWRPPFRRVHLHMAIDRPFCRITPIGRKPGISGVLEGHDVRLEDASGHILTERNNARASFPGGRRLLWWDDLDMAYFANYAFWNYFTFPRLLMDSRIQWSEPETGHLEALFPADITTHSPRQEFRFDSGTGLLLQHNYTVDVFGSWATAANRVLDHRQLDGIPYPSERLVTPSRSDGQARSGPTLIHIKVHGLRWSVGEMR